MSNGILVKLEEIFWILVNFLQGKYQFLSKTIATHGVIHDGKNFNRALEEHIRRVLDTSSLYLSFFKSQYESAQAVTPAILYFGERIKQDLIINQCVVIDADDRAIASLVMITDNKAVFLGSIAKKGV